MKKDFKKIGLIFFGIIFFVLFFDYSGEVKEIKEKIELEEEKSVFKNTEEIEVMEKLEIPAVTKIETVLEKENVILVNEEKTKKTAEITLKETSSSSGSDGFSFEKESNPKEVFKTEVKETLETTNNKELFLVSSVVDGDTLKISRAGKVETIRVIGIDTPETVHPTKAVQCFGKEASARAKYLLENKMVEVVYDESQGKQDKYGRILAYIILPDGRDFGELMLSEGYANEYTYDQKYDKQAKYKQAEKFAQENKLGLWNEEACFDFEVKIPQDSNSKSITILQSEGKNSSPAKESACVIKGNINSKKEKIYHLPSQSFYEKTLIDESAGERWFCTEEEALAAGWRKSKI